MKIKEKIVDEIVYYVDEAIAQMADVLRVYHLVKSCLSLERLALIKKLNKAFLIYDEHTAETAVYYAVDLGNHIV